MNNSASVPPPRDYCVSTLPFSRFPIEETLRKIRDAGFGAVEIARGHLDQEPGFGRIKRLAEKCGIRITSLLAGFTPADEAGMGGLIELMDCLPELGARRIGISSGGPEQCVETQIAAIIRNTRTLVREAEKRGIGIAFYTHTNNMVYNLARTERIFAEIPSRNFGLYYSPYHFYAAGDDPVPALERLQSRLCGVYFNCGVDPVTGKEPFWGPDIDYKAVCKAINESGYAGDIMLLYLGLNVGRPDPIVGKLLAVRRQIDGFFGQ